LHSLHFLDDGRFQRLPVPSVEIVTILGIGNKLQAGAAGAKAAISEPSKPRTFRDLGVSAGLSQLIFGRFQNISRPHRKDFIPTTAMHSSKSPEVKTH